MTTSLTALSKIILPAGKKTKIKQFQFPFKKKTSKDVMGSLKRPNDTLYKLKAA